VPGCLVQPIAEIRGIITQNEMFEGHGLKIFTHTCILASS